MRCDIIIPVWDQLEATRACVDSILKNTDNPFRLIVIDNGSGISAKDYLKSLSGVKGLDILLIRNEENLGFVKAINQGMAASDAGLICLMNNDTIAAAGWLGEMIGIMESSPDIGVVNPSSNTLGQFPGPGESIESCASGLKNFKGQMQEMYSARGFCMLIKRAVVDSIGFLDEAYGMGYFEESDYSVRARRAGFRIVRAKGAYVYHKEETTFNSMADKRALFEKSEKVYNRKWGRPLDLVLVTRQNDFFKDRMPVIEKLLSAGYKINVFSDKKDVSSGPIDHINLRVRHFSRFHFLLGVSYKIQRRRKKGIDCVIVEGDRLYRSLKALSFMHGIEVIKLDDSAVLEYCDKLSREGL